MPHQPPTLPEDARPEVKREFDRLVELIGDRAHAIDGLALEMLATNIAQWRRAQAEVDRLGLVVMSGGTAIANPSIGIAAAAQSQVLSLANAIGLSAPLRRRLAR